MNKNQILTSYKGLLKSAKTMKSYNFREYFLRKIRHDYRIKQSFNINEETQRLDELKRIIIVQNLFSNISN